LPKQRASSCKASDRFGEQVLAIDATFAARYALLSPFRHVLGLTFALGGSELVQLLLAH
jgi:hypothetical protein